MINEIIKTRYQALYLTKYQNHLIFKLLLLTLNEL